jgi:hypothetical protein
MALNVEEVFLKSRDIGRDWRTVMEKRKFTRIPIRIEAFVNCLAKSFKAEIVNLSLNGIRLRSPEAMEEGGIARITLYLMGTEQRLDLSICLIGKVLRRGDGFFSLQFQEMDLDSFTQLRNIIAYNAGDGDRVMREFIDSLQPTEDEVKKAV